MWSAIILLLLGAGVAGYNAYKMKQTKNKLDAMVDTPYTIPQEYFDNLGLAQSEAQTGFSAGTTEALRNSFAQNMTASTNAVLQGGGGVNDIAKLYGVANDSNEKLAIADETLRNQKMQNLYQATSTIAGQKALEYKLNVYDPQRNNRVAAAQLMQQYGAGINSGINTGIQGAAGLANYGQSDSLQKLFRNWDKMNNTNTNVGNPAMPQPIDDGGFASPPFANMTEANNAIDVTGLGTFNSINNYNNLFGG